jgi:hypothetical protein
MVRIVNYQKKVSEEGKVFFTLELQGGIEMVKSVQSGKFYLTARKVSMSTTFDENVCQSLIGTELPGEVKKVNCEPYEYTIKDTGEMITLTHRYEYFNGEETPAKAEMSDTTVDDFMSKNPIATAFSLNGHND